MARCMSLNILDPMPWMEVVQDAKYTHWTGWQTQPKFCVQGRIGDLLAIHEWCIDSCRGPFLSQMTTWSDTHVHFVFKDSADQVHFKIRWADHLYDETPDPPRRRF